MVIVSFILICNLKYTLPLAVRANLYNMKKLFVLCFILAISSGVLSAQDKSPKEIKAAQKEERKIDKEIKAEHRATSQYLENKNKLKKANRELVKDSKRFERQKRKENLSPKDIRGWEADLVNQRRKIEKLEADIEKYHQRYGKNISNR
jgi:septal ring factor EnvC (AmiA/AmiB activator)